MLLQYSENKRYMQIKRQIFSIVNIICYLCIETKKRAMFIVLITKSYDKSVWCNFSVHCLIYSLANDNLRKRKTPDEKMHILLLYILKYAGVDSNILQNRREYD